MSTRCTSIIVVIVFSLLSGSAHARRTVELFDESVIESPVSLTHPVLVAELLPDSGKEIVSFGVDEQGTRWLHLYKLNPNQVSYLLDAAVPLPRELLRFDLSEPLPGHFQTLYFLGAKGIYQYDPVAKLIKHLRDVESLFIKDDPDYISRDHFVVDINQDGVDEFLLPNFRHISFLSHTSDGSFSMLELPVKATAIVNDDGMSFIPNKYYIDDINQDGRKDFIIAAQGKLIAYHQQVDGLLSAKAQEIPLAADISAIDWWHKRDATGRSLDQANLTYRKLELLRDINHDGTLDMVVKATQSSGVLERVNDYQVFIGALVDNQLRFKPQTSSVISAEGTLSGFELIDIDNDGRLEAILGGFDIGLSQIIGALLSGGIDQDVYLFAMDSADNFATKPNVAKEVELSFSLSSGQTGSPVVKLADLNGDNRKDLVLSYGEKKLKVYWGIADKKVFNKRSVKHATVLPQDGDSIVVSDLNNDGKDDLVLKYGRLDKQELAHTIRLLIAK